MTEARDPSSTPGVARCAPRNVANLACGVVGILCFAVIAPMLLIHLVVGQQDEQLEAQSLARLADVREQAEQIHDSAKKASASIRVVRLAAARAAQVRSSSLLASLVNATPPGITLNELELDATSPKDPASGMTSVTLNGLADSREALAKLVQTLKNDPAFKTMQVIDADHVAEPSDAAVPFHLALLTEPGTGEPRLASNGLTARELETR